MMHGAGEEMGDYSKNVVKGLWWGCLTGLVIKRIDQPSLACVRIFRHPYACQDALSKNIRFSDDLLGWLFVTRWKIY
ncbi:hypothetical protein HMPREF3050_02900 [Neisseria sp. HMSC065D04]|nr:hypothetical protein HMPREF3050_02900 [Neisseria sp. HMSC065D04]